MLYYSTVQEVKSYTGVRPQDFDCTSEQLDAIIESWLIQAKDLIDSDRNRDYHAEVTDGKREQIPAGIHNIALRIVANMVAQANLRRQTPIVRVDDFSFQMADDRVFTSHIKDDLSRYPYKPNIGMLRVGRTEG